MTLLFSHRLPPQSGHAFRMARGQRLEVIDPQGEQVADLYAFAEGDHRCALSSGRSIDYAGRIYLTTGDILYSNDSRPMLTITADRVGRHDFLLTPCSPETFVILYDGPHRDHPSCLRNFAGALAPFGIAPHQIGTTFNIFMNVEIGRDGAVTIGPPLSRPGDTLELRAEMDLIVGVTACSAEKSNNHILKPIDIALHG